ncbi:dnd [Symbiodinium sp. CCMP2592]|nr:dnd [Symbiodinium sp. CCMP2592]
MGNLTGRPEMAADTPPFRPRPAERLPRPVEVQTSQVFFAGIPSDMDEDALRALFHQVGVVKELTLLRREDGTSRGRGTCIFDEPPTAAAAIRRFKYRNVGGSIIWVTEDRRRKGAAEALLPAAVSAQKLAEEQPAVAAAPMDSCQAEVEAAMQPKAEATMQPEAVGRVLPRRGPGWQASMEEFLFGCPEPALRVRDRSPSVQGPWRGRCESPERDPKRIKLQRGRTPPRRKILWVRRVQVP